MNGKWNELYSRIRVENITKERDGYLKVLQEIFTILDPIETCSLQRHELANAILEVRRLLDKALEKRKSDEKMAEFYADQYGKHERGEPSVFSEFEQPPIHNKFVKEGCEQFENEEEI